MKRKRKPTLPPPPSWDYGPRTAAQDAGKILEPAIAPDAATGETQNPNGVMRARRIDMLERYYRQGVISARAYNAGERLRNATEATECGPGWPDNDRVQSSPKPDHAVTIQIDRLSKLVAISKHVQPQHAAIIDHVVIRNGSIGGCKVKGKRPFLGANLEKGKAALADALEALANEIEKK